jgi:hypothetical protein
MIYIALVNMCKCNVATHALLNSNKNSHLILIQEPWYDRIGTAQKDNTWQGIDVLGGAACPKWELIYPGFTEDQHLKVMAYAR